MTTVPLPVSPVSDSPHPAEKLIAPHWQLYLLECADGSLYCGITTDLPRRLDQHNGLRPGGARYTRSRRPVRLLYRLDCVDHGDALRRERAVKKLPRARKHSYFLPQGVPHAVAS